MAGGDLDHCGDHPDTGGKIALAGPEPPGRGLDRPLRGFRPPVGRVKNTGKGSPNMYTVIRKYGYDHILLWDVSETNAKKAFPKVRNGSILLYHARQKDYNCLAELIPALLEAGFEPVTVSELFEMEPPQPGGELFVYDSHEYTGY